MLKRKGRILACIFGLEDGLGCVNRVVISGGMTIDGYLDWESIIVTLLASYTYVFCLGHAIRAEHKVGDPSPNLNGDFLGHAEG